MTISTQSKAIRVQTGDARGREIKAANPLRAGPRPRPQAELGRWTVFSFDEIIIDPMPDSEQFQQFFIELAKQQLSAEITGAGDTQDPPPTYYCGCSLSVVITPAISDDMAAGSPVL